MKAITLAVCLALIVPNSASAGLKLTGDAKPRHFKWAALAQARVPLPNERIRIISDYDPMYVPGTHFSTIYLPKAGWGGWTYMDERTLFYHELGHSFDHAHMNKAERNSFRVLAGTSASWWNHNARWKDTNLKLAPAEMFGEMYASCAMGMTRESLTNKDIVSYGWVPPVGNDAAICELIRSAA
jgi:hypothetical protein